VLHYIFLKKNRFKKNMNPYPKKKVRFWGDSNTIRKPCAKKTAYFKKKDPPYRMIVLSLV